MAKAIAICTCEKCGNTFERTNICYNRRDADSWEAWAKDHFTLCPECYAAEKAAQMAEANDIREMHYGEYKQNFADCKTVPGSYDPKTKMIQVYVPKDIPEESASAESSPSQDPAPSSEREAKFIQALHLFLNAFLRVNGGKEHSRTIKKSGKIFIAELLYIDSSGWKSCITICPQTGMYLHTLYEGRSGDWFPCPGSSHLSLDLLKKVADEMNKMSK